MAGRTVNDSKATSTMSKPNPRLAALAKEFSDNRAGVDYLDELAGTEGRDLTADERIAYDGAFTRMEQIEAEITKANERQARFDAVAPVVATIQDTHTRVEHVEPRSPFTYDPSKAGRPYVPRLSVEELGEQMHARGSLALDLMNPDRSGRREHADDVNTLRRMGVLARDEDLTLTRVLAHGVAADGTAPITIEGDLIKFIDDNRYAVNAARQLPMPDNHAPTFKRPRATQFTTVGQQVTEGDVLSSQRFQNTGDTVTKGTYGGALSLSEQEQDWTDPALLGLAIQDLAQQYAIQTDTVLCSAISTAAIDGNETVLSLTASSSDFITAIAAAAAQVYSTAKRMADVIFVDVNRWAYIAGLVDGDGRPVFPIAGPFNTAGMNAQGVASFSGLNVLGLNVVVDPNFSSNFWAVGVSQLCEFYEQNKGLLSINVPSTLEVTYAYRGYAAANVYSQALSLLEAV